MSKPFSERDVSVTLRGDEWAVLLAKIGGKPLSAEGRCIYAAGAKKLGDQLLAAAEVAKS
jgi:hypothetical protein